VFDNLKEYFYKQNGTKELASTRIVYKHTNKPLTHILHEDTVRFSGDQNGEIYFEIANHSEFHLTIDNLNTNKNKINKIYLLRPFETIIIERNEVLGCVMILEEYITDKGKPLMFTDERSRCFGIIKIGFDRVFGETSSREIGYYWKYPIPETVCKRTEIDGIGNTSRALLTAGRTLEQIRFKETTISEKLYAFINFDFGLTYGFWA